MDLEGYATTSNQNRHRRVYAGQPIFYRRGEDTVAIHPIQPMSLFFAVYSIRFLLAVLTIRLILR